MSTKAHRSADLVGAPFRGSAALASGVLTPGQLRGPAWRQIFRDVYVDARADDTHLLRCYAMALRLPEGAVVNGRSAAEVWGVRLAEPDLPVEILTPRRMRQVDGSLVRTGRLDPTEVTCKDGVPLPTPLHTAWEIARALPILEAVPWIDALARVRRVETAALVEHSLLHPGETGCVAAKRTLALCDRRAESRPESIVRVSLVLGGVEAPVPQWRVVVDRQFIARVDLAWPELRLALEYDGQWHADPAQLTRDRRRIRALNAAGWHVFPVTRHDLRDLPALVEAVRTLVAERRS